MSAYPVINTVKGYGIAHEEDSDALSVGIVKIGVGRALELVVSRNGVLVHLFVCVAHICQLHFLSY